MTNSITILIACLVITTIMSFFCGAFSIGSFNIEDELSEPSVWDVISFTGHGFYGLLTFTITGMPAFIGIIFWLIQAVELLAIVYLIRGNG